MVPDYLTAEDSEFFSINAESGTLRLAKPLWPIKTSSMTFPQWPPAYTLNVAAEDRGGRINHTKVTVSLNPGPGAVLASLPRFRQTAFIVKVEENIPAGHIVVCLKDLLEAQPVAPVVFRLLNYSDKFAVSTNSGFLVTLASLDREEEELYRLRVQVSSLDGLPSKFPHIVEIEVSEARITAFRIHPRISFYLKVYILYTQCSLNNIRTQCKNEVRCFNFPQCII